MRFPILEALIVMAWLGAFVVGVIWMAATLLSSNTYETKTKLEYTLKIESASTDGHITHDTTYVYRLK